MTKKEFTEAIRALLSKQAGKLTWGEKLALARKAIIDADKEHPRNTPNKGQPWSDDELRVILQTPPTHENIQRLARAFGRGYGSVEQIVRWAAEDQKEVDRKRPNDAFISQIKRIAREVGWRAY